MTEFTKFRDAVNKQIKSMHSDKMFVVDAGKYDLWETYLSSFAEGDDPIYKERTEHDCNCCKQFIRDVGHLINIKGDDVITVWDVHVGGIYQPVADALASKVRSLAVKDIAAYDHRKVGTKYNRQTLESGDTITWDHFHAELPNSVVARGESVEQMRGTARDNFSVLKRSVEAITMDSIDTVMDLISQKSIYRGEEHLATVKKLKQVKKGYDKAKRPDLFLWLKSVELGYQSRFRNTVIGTLLTDISDGVDLERAVKSFEDKVAPHNYKRTSALITQKMIDQAREKVNELGLEDALRRRYATAEDLTVNNVLFVDRSVKSRMKDGFDALSPTKADKKPNSKNVQEIPVDEFMEKILPEVDSMEVLVENRLSSNLVSLIAPEYPDAGRLFKWNNNFSWSYNGEVTDSIKEKVKKAGGSVTGDVRVSLSWFNRDDLDIHVKEPTGREIYFGNKRGMSGGVLDVDMNVHGESREPVENVIWKSKRQMSSGTYQVVINNYTKRESDNVGFVVELEYDGRIETFTYTKPVRQSGNVNVVDINVDKDGNISHTGHIQSESISKEVWGVATEKFQKVEMVMNSPNHWDGEETGNRHVFFMLENCRNPESSRGFYNEFLTGELTPHRKVFEVLSSKMKTPESDNQLSGLGFSSTIDNNLVCRVHGKVNKTFNIKF